MDQRQRVGMQRALVREGLGKLRAAVELFGIEDGAVAGEDPSWHDFVVRVDKLERYVFEDSPIA